MDSGPGTINVEISSNGSRRNCYPNRSKSPFRVLRPRKIVLMSLSSLELDGVCECWVPVSIEDEGFESVGNGVVRKGDWIFGKMPGGTYG